MSAKTFTPGNMVKSHLHLSFVSSSSSSRETISLMFAAPQWPYTGRKYTTGYPMGGPMSQMDDDMVPGPGPMPGMPPQYPPFYRYVSGEPRVC